MKKLVLAAGLAALLATPALAQSYDSEYGTGNSLPTPPSWAAQQNAGAGSAFAYAPRALRSAGSDSVYVDGHNVGADPDANIRLQLRRDPPGRD
jgi:opacity protein-like surface antigen